ncbi:50S ribosomal protein L18 [Mariprofundus ferrooxydans]|uniref:Large ribosomal subunit protein uL18 n=1 Tax=Mariprofundus ferrooxydans PV-1 TaxID=314345 RepID=Q0EW52_9PROT|nr:50S ribosomal protein L18 [Mariprofundus ferrooxydans]EAU53503.1 50S ribosomal protein L18 [Mariprofundus ferrooxydans PV-1]KON46383.1 50S ribosomal protein L18 [Mariprofundus ferrooxydans]
MSIKRYESNGAVRRARKVRARVKASRRLRLSIFRSARHVYAQIIDDANGTTLAAASSLDEAVKNGGNKVGAEAVGKLIAERAIKAGVEVVAFDRGSFAYHGRVQALAEGARAGGLKF